jgi:hypothetical protein
VSSGLDEAGLGPLRAQAHDKRKHHDRFVGGKNSPGDRCITRFGPRDRPGPAARGAIVGLNYASNDEAARECLAEIEAKDGQAFLAKAMLGSFEAAEQLTAVLDEELIKRTGSNGLDILVNNAGGGPVADIDATTPEIFERILSDNMRGPFYVTKLLKALLRDNGRVLFMSSVGARKALPQFVIYAMAKSAIETFTVVVVYNPKFAALNPHQRIKA